MSDKYNQIKQTWKIKSILNEAANDWKQSYGCYPTVKEFINLINEYSVTPLNVSDILVEDRLITSNDITWLSKTIINEQDAGDAFFYNASPKDIEEAIKGAPAMENTIRDRYARAQATKTDNATQAKNAAEGKKEPINAERKAAEAAKSDPAADVSTAEKMKNAQEETAKSNSAQREASRQERIRQAKATRATEQQKAADWQEANRRERVRPEVENTQVPPESVKPVGEKFTAPSWNIPPASTIAKTIVKSPYTLAKGLVNSAPSVLGSIKGGELAKEYIGPAAEIPGEVVGALVGGKVGTMGLGIAKNMSPWAPKDAALTRNREYESRHKATLTGTLGWLGGLHLAEPFTKDMDTLPRMGLDWATMNAGERIATKVAPMVSRLATKVAPNAMNIAGKIGAKIGKFAPVVGAGLIAGGLYGAGQKALAGDPYGAGLDAVSSVISPVPIIGIPVGTALDAASAYHDMSAEDKEELKKNAAKSIPTPQNIGKAVKTGAGSLVPSGLQVPEESEDEKQKKRMLNPELQAIQEQAIRGFLRTLEKEGGVELEKEGSKTEIPSYLNPNTFLHWLEKQLPKQAEPTARPVKEMEPNKFEIPTTPTVYPMVKSPSLTKPNPYHPSPLYDPIDPINLPKTDTSTPTAPKTDTSTPTAPKTDTSTPTDTDLATKKKTDTDTDLATKKKTDTDTDLATKKKTDTKVLPIIINRKIIPPPNVDEKITDEDKDKKSPSAKRLTTSSPEDIMPDFEAPGERLGARKNSAVPYYDQNNKVNFTSQYGQVNESHSRTLNTKSAIQARAKKQQYKVVVVQNGKKLEIFAKSIQGIRRAVYGKQNFRVYDGKGSDITNYFKRLMASKKST